MEQKRQDNNMLNVRDKVTTVNLLLSVNLQFNISGGQMRWVKNDQRVDVNEFEVIPALKFKKIVILTDYEEQDMVAKFNSALGKVQDKFKKLLESHNDSDDDEDKDSSTPDQQPAAKPTEGNGEVRYASDDVYNGRNPQDFPHIWKQQEDTEVSIIVNLLKLSKEMQLEKDTLSFDFSPQRIMENIISHTEAKKAKILVNNNELRPKEAMGFLKEMLPYLKFEIFLDK